MGFSDLGVITPFISLDYSACGESPVNFRARIVGGRDSERGWWPWQIGLYKLNNKGIETVFFPNL